MKRCILFALACLLLHAPATLAGESESAQPDFGLSFEWLSDLWQRTLDLWAGAESSTNDRAGGERPDSLRDSVGPGLVPVGSELQNEAEGEEVSDLSPEDPEDEVGPGLVPVG